MDASVVVDAATGFSVRPWAALVEAVRELGTELIAPQLMWSEAYSVLHERQWRRIMYPEEATDALRRVRQAPIEVRQPTGLRERAWEIADRMGWAKTYDAEYCALAELLDCELVTADRRLRAAGARLGYVLTVAEMASRYESEARDG